MPNYLVRTKILRTVAVTASCWKDAVQIGLRDAQILDPKAIVEFNLAIELDPSYDPDDPLPLRAMAGQMERGMAAGLVKSVAQTCFWCRKTAHREDWGPGWVRCPNCQRFAPSAAERREIENATKEKS